MMKRSAIKTKRSTPRRREAPQWSWDEWQAANILLMVRSLGCCEKCGNDQGPFERHHRKRRRDGGDRLANVVLLCRSCHRHVTEHPAEARKYGWIVSVSRDPADVPFLWHAYRQEADWVYLDDEGNTRVAFGDIEDAHA